MEFLLYVRRQSRDDIVVGRRAARASQTGGRIETRRLVCGSRPHAVRFSGKPLPPSHENFSGYALRGLRAGSRLYLHPCRSGRDKLRRRVPDRSGKTGVRSSDRKPLHVQGIGGKTVAVWWSNFIGHYPRKELSRKPEYSFTAWENCNVVPEFQTD